MTDSLKQATTYLAETGDGYVQAKIGLMRKRGALVAEIETLNGQLAHKTADLRAIEAALRVLDPQADIEGMPARRPAPAFGSFRGELARHLLTALRNASGKLTTRDLAIVIMRERHMDASDPGALKLIQRRVSHSLALLRNKGLLRSEQADASGVLRWWLAGDAIVPPEGNWRNGSPL